MCDQNPRRMMVSNLVSLECKGSDCSLGTQDIPDSPGHAAQREDGSQKLENPDNVLSHCNRYFLLCKKLSQNLKA